MTAAPSPFRRLSRAISGFLVVLATVFGIAAMLPAQASAGSGAPAIWSDRPDYAPGETVYLNGDGWGMGEVVHINVNDGAGQTWSRDVDVTADLFGMITDQLVLPDWFIAMYTVTATGPSGTATTTFTDGNVKFDIAPTAARAQFVETLHSAATNCTGAVKSGYPKTLNNSNGDTVGVGNSESLRLDASATTTNSPTLSFQAWSSTDTPASPLIVIGGTSGLSICVPGFQSGTRSYRATYGNAAPVIARDNASVTVNEGSTASNTGTWSDANPLETVTLSASIGTVTKSGTNASGTWSWSFATTDGPQSQTVTITATDSRGLSTSTTFTLTVNNVAPTVAFTSAPTTALEGETKTYTYSITDPGADTVSSVATGCGAFGVKSNASNTNTSGSFDCTFPDGTLSSVVNVRATDSDGAAGNTATQSVSIANVAPTASFPATGMVDEGSTSSFAFTSPSDPSSADTAAGFHYAFSCTDASLASASYSGSGMASSVSCSFDDGPSTPTVRARVIDKDGGFTEYTTAVTVVNVAPTATFSNNGPVDEGSSFSLTMSNGDDVSSADQAAEFEFAFDCGDGSGYGAWSSPAALSASANCSTSDNGGRAVKAKIRDKDGGVSEYTDTVSVSNVAPTATFSNDGPVDEGSSFSLTMSNGDDVSSADQAAEFEFAFDCGDGSGYGAWSSPAALSASANCPTSDNGTRAVKAKIRDKDGGVSEYTDSVTVKNVAPSVTLSGPASSEEGETESYSYSWTDLGSDDSFPGGRELGRLRAQGHRLRHGLHARREDGQLQVHLVGRLRRRHLRRRGDGQRRRRWRRIGHQAGRRRQRRSLGDLHRAGRSRRGLRDQPLVDGRPGPGQRRHAPVPLQLRQRRELERLRREQHVQLPDERQRHEDGQGPGPRRRRRRERRVLE